ncbi:MAG: SPOR domain-containing protein, partial [Candidatus Latescibacterota bacterium]
MTTYEIQTTLEVLKSAHEDGTLPVQMDAPLRSMVSDIGSRAETEPLSIYLCSSDENAETRNFFAHVLAMTIKTRVSSTYLVDCDFLATGMNGIVPHRDALGFLDLLLYGTSLSVITQEASAGIPAIGAGSFPVTKKCPFAMDTFDNTHRYLANHAGCVIYCGPVVDDDDVIHPIADHVDLVILVNVSEEHGFRPGSLDPLETKVAAAKGADAWIIRIDARPAARPVGKTPSVDSRAPDIAPKVPAEQATFTRVAKTDDGVDRESVPVEKEPPEPVIDTPISEAQAPRQDDRPHLGDKPGARGVTESAATPVQKERVKARAATVGARPATTDMPRKEFDRKLRGSNWLRVVTPIVAIVLVAVVIWWLYLTKSVREREQQLETMASGTPAVEEPTQPADTTQQPVATTTPPAVTPVAEEETRQETAAPEPEVRTTGGVPLAERLDDYANKYLVHVSSFRRLDRARDEALYLMGREYPVFLYRIDLGGKGIWYRVYVGPAETRDEARAFKIKLDEDPRIQSTRIARV